MTIYELADAMGATLVIKRNPGSDRQLFYAELGFYEVVKTTRKENEYAQVFHRVRLYRDAVSYGLGDSPELAIRDLVEKVRGNQATVIHEGRARDYQFPKNIEV